MLRQHPLMTQLAWLHILIVNQRYFLTFQYLNLFGYKVRYTNKKDYRNDDLLLVLVTRGQIAIYQYLRDPKEELKYIEKYVYK